jgi:hypothetical protein
LKKKLCLLVKDYYIYVGLIAGALVVTFFVAGTLVFDKGWLVASGRQKG